jgi:hypothetical protein
MKRIALAGTVLLALVTAATTAAWADPFAAAYGNTVTQTTPDGKKQVIYVNQDGTWERRGDAGDVKGTYTWKDDHTACFTVTSPAPKDPSKATGCNDIKGDHKVGDTWSEPLPNGGGSITMSITAGR